jgi:uncharacterized membrane protein YphA (DoxX/SURF4 family)
MDRSSTSDRIETVRSFLSNDYLALAARVIVGLLFIFASIDKIANPEAFAASIANYKLMSPFLTTASATVLPWIELLAGFALLFGIFHRGGAFILAVLLVIFTAAIVSALIRGLDISCGCLTQDPQANKIGWTKVAENVGVFVLTTFLFYSTSVKFTLEEFLNKRP